MFVTLVAGCNMPGFGNGAGAPVPTPESGSAADLLTADISPTSSLPNSLAQTASPPDTSLATAAATEAAFEVGNEITIGALRSLNITGSQITFEQELASTFYYQQFLASYVSEGSKIYGLLTVPGGDPPATGFKAVVFCHGYIPPDSYHTTERYVAYVDYLARNGFVVFKIDYRGHGQSEGEPTGSYFSPGYTIDAVSALKSLQTLDFIDPQGIGMWGHSMAGNLVLRAMLIEPDVRAGVIWAGAVYSYDDFTAYGIRDSTYRPPATAESGSDPRSKSREILDTYGLPDTAKDYWRAVSLTENIDFLNRPLQIHHAQDDPVVSIHYSEDLAAVLLENAKQYEFFQYEGGGHNLNSPYFEQAMQRTVAFFRDNL